MNSRWTTWKAREAKKVVNLCLCIGIGAPKIELEKNPHYPRYVEYGLHKKRAEALSELKKKYFQDAKKNSDTLVLEFNYAQNFPLPKLSITKVFYKRLVWMYLFKVHVHNDDTSFVYTCMESECKKGAKYSGFLYIWLCTTEDCRVPKYKTYSSPFWCCRWSE